MEITPDKISHLEPNEIFVFGSNLQGEHAGGAARFAVMKFGAEWGKGIGIQGNSYAIPTLNFAAYAGTKLDDLKLPVPVIGKYVNQFLDFAANHPNLFFYVTPIGCGIAGFTEAEMAPLFKGALQLDNVALPASFIRIIAPNELNQLNESVLDKIITKNIRKIIK